MLINENIGNGDEEIVYRNCLNSAGVGDECVNSDHNGVSHLTWVSNHISETLCYILDWDYWLLLHNWQL